MFNIGSFEVLLIGVIALLVLGPERLPGAVRTAGLWIGRFRRSFYRVKAEIERELNADEVRRQLHNESVLAELEATNKEVAGLARQAGESASQIVEEAGSVANAAHPTEPQQQTAGAGSSTAAGASVGGEIRQSGSKTGKALYGTGNNPKLAGRTAQSASDRPAES